MFQSRVAAEHLDQPAWRRTTGLAPVCEAGDRGLLASLFRRHRDQGLLEPQPRWRQVVVDELVQADDSAKSNTSRPGHPPGLVDGDVDRMAVFRRTRRILRAQPVGDQRGIVGKRSRPIVQHRSPGPLPPGRWARVVDVHASMKQHPFPSPEPAPNVDVVQPARQHLEPGDHAVLLSHQGMQLLDGHMGRMRNHRDHRETGCFICGLTAGRICCGHAARPGRRRSDVK